MDEYYEESYEESNEEEMYVEFAFMEVNELIEKYGVDFFLSRISHEHLINIVRAIV